MISLIKANRTEFRQGIEICTKFKFFLGYLFIGIVGGGHYTNKGGATNFLCMPLNPQHLQVEAGTGGSRDFIYSTEYEIDGFSPFSHLHNHNAPCAVCRVIRRSTLLMIPAKTSCPLAWTVEYQGYLMSAYHDHGHQSEYICVDENAEALPGTSSGNNGALLYLVEATCGSNGLPCVPYVAGNELACVVCSI